MNNTPPDAQRPPLPTQSTKADIHLCRSHDLLMRDLKSHGTLNRRPVIALSAMDHHQAL